MKDLVINSTVQHTLLMFVPLVFAYVLQRARVRIWSIAGGVLGGILLGPAVFGSAAPAYWSGLFQGGVHEQALYEQTERQQAASYAVAEQTGASESFLLQLKATQKYELQQVQEEYKKGQWRDQRTIRNFATTLIILIFLGGITRSKARGTTDPPLTMLTVGIWTALVPLGVVVACSYWFWNIDPGTSIAFGACLAVGPWTIRGWEQTLADESIHEGAALMLYCGRVTWVVAGRIAVYAAWPAVPDS